MGDHKWLLLAGVALQVLVLAGMIYSKAMPVWTGEVVWLRVVPVDPRDMFRGDYVNLGYDFSQLQPDAIPALGQLDDDRRHEWEGATVYVSLEPEEDGKHWKMSGISAKPPAEGKFIRGTLVKGPRVQCGIESFYVQEGHGREYEDAALGHRLSAEVALDRNGQAVLRDLHVEPPAPGTTPSYEREGRRRWPSDTTYYVRRLPKATVQIDGRLDEPEWARANVERQFRFPWKETDAPATEFLSFCDEDHLYFAFRVVDADIVARDELRDKMDVIFEDRVELFFSVDPQMEKYFGFEIDPRGRVLDYRGTFYRQFDRSWRCQGLETAGAATDDGYVIEGRIPLDTLVEMGFPRLTPGEKIRWGLYGAEFSHDPDSDKPIEAWISWIDPETPEPDFHVPSSLGWLQVVE